MHSFLPQCSLQHYRRRRFSAGWWKHHVQSTFADTHVGFVLSTPRGKKNKPAFLPNCRELDWMTFKVPFQLQ